MVYALLRKEAVLPLFFYMLDREELPWLADAP